LFLRSGPTTFRVHKKGRVVGSQRDQAGAGVDVSPFSIAVAPWRHEATPPARPAHPDRVIFRETTVADIQLDEGDSVERALKQFRRKLQREGLFAELRRRRHYLKPSAARVVKSALARRRKRKNLRRSRD
jgi:small subunit ribosomal protein S21